MIRIATVILSVASGRVADAFHLPSSSRVTCDARGSRRSSPAPATLSTKYARNSQLVLSLSKDDARLTEDIDSLDTGLALEIEEALSLAQDALGVEVEVEASPDEDDIDEIANMLMEKPPTPLPVPPKEDPPASVVSLSLEEGVDEAESPTPADGKDLGEALMEIAAEGVGQVGDLISGIKEDPEESAEESAKPAPPDTPPPAAGEDFGEAMKKKMTEEIERLRNLIFGVEEELTMTESSTAEAEDVAAVLKKEIEDSMREREAMVKRIESEFNSEKELLVAQMGTASEELSVVMEQSAQNITEAKSKASRAEKELIARIDSFKGAIDEVTAGTIEINKDKERIQQSKQTMLDKVIQEGKNNLAKFKKSLQFDVDYAKQINEDLIRRAEEAEGKVRSVYDQINQMRTERVSLQQQIVDVEKNALEEIETLQREMKLDEERFAVALQKERDRLDNVLDVAYQAYAIKVCKKIVERQTVEAEYQEKLRVMNFQIIDKKEKQAARVKEYLDKLEEKHQKERIAIYQEKIETVSAIRKEMNAELAIEYDKIEETHKGMKAKIGAVKKQTAEIKAEFEKEMSKRRQLAKEEEGELLRQIEDVRVDMTNEMKTQQRLHEEQKYAYLEGMNTKIAESEAELRQRWKELADAEKTYKEVSAKRDGLKEDVAEKKALINSYEKDRTSFRKSLRLTARVAREKIGSKTRRLLKRKKKEAP